MKDFFNISRVPLPLITATAGIALSIASQASEPELIFKSGILFASNGLGGDAFSASMGFDGDTAVVGAYERLTPSNRGKGSAYIFDRRPDGAWEEAAYLTGTETVGLFRYGYSVDISGDTVVVGTKDTFPPFKRSGHAFNCPLPEEPIFPLSYS